MPILETVSKINLDETADNYPIHNYADGFQSDIQNTIHKHNEKNEAKQLNNQGNSDFDLNNNCNVLPSDVKSCQRSSNSVVITETATEEKWLQMQFPSHESGDSVKCQLPYTSKCCLNMLFKKFVLTKPFRLNIFKVI